MRALRETDPQTGGRLRFHWINDLAAAPSRVSTASGVRYNANMNGAPKVSSESVHDETLIDWFLSLTPAERLAELESRLAFFAAARRNGNAELPQDPRAP
jgi:hypothetical protein